MGLFSKSQGKATKAGGQQRRAYVRVAGSSRVDLRAGGFSTATQILDISEGGMRCSVAHSFPVNVGQMIRAIVTVGSDEIEIQARIVRQRAESAFLQDLGLQFVHNDREKRDKLRKHILDRQFEQRRAQA